MKSIKIPLTREQLEARRKQAADAGFKFEGDSGQSSVKGIKFSYNYDGSVLDVTLLKVGFPASLKYNEDSVEKKVLEVLAKEGIQNV